MIFYRFEDPIVHDIYYDLVSVGEVYERTFDMIKETLCGWWIHDQYDNNIWSLGDRKRWVSKTARKRFAYPTREEAWLSFRARKEKQVRILKYQLEVAEARLDKAKKSLPLVKEKLYATSFRLSTDVTQGNCR